MELGVGVTDGPLRADWGSDTPATQLPLWTGQVLGEMLVQGIGGEVCWGNGGGGGGGAGTFLCIKAGRACELCRGGSRPHKAQCGEACPTSLAVTGNNTDLAIKAIPNLLVINHPPDSCEWKWKNLIPPLPFPSSPGPAPGFRVTSPYIWGSLLGAGLFPFHFPWGRVQLGEATGWPAPGRPDSCTETRD